MGAAACEPEVYRTDGTKWPAERILHREGTSDQERPSGEPADSQVAEERNESTAYGERLSQMVGWRQVF